jgi:hypothetical protein
MLKQRRGKEIKMIKTTNDQIAYYWSRGTAATNGTGAFTTDGKNIYSYRLMIGTTNEQGEKILFDWTSGAMGFQSQTTSCHVGKARLAADWIQVNDAELVRA